MRTSTPSFTNLISNPVVTIIILLAVSLFLLFSPITFSAHIKTACFAPIRPFQWATCFCSNTASDFFENIFSSWRDAQAKRELEEQVAALKNTITGQQDALYKLQNKLHLVSKFQAENKPGKTALIPADIIGYDASNFRKSIVISAGQKQGVTCNDVVVANNALIGRVVTVNSGNSVVQLITDPSSRIPGRVLQTREQVILEGNASPLCQLKYVPRAAKLKKGDDIVSSDIGGQYPPSLPIATVVDISTKGGNLFQSVKVQPKVNIAKIESVIVLTNIH